MLSWFWYFQAHTSMEITRLMWLCLTRFICKWGNKVDWNILHYTLTKDLINVGLLVDDRLVLIFNHTMCFIAINNSIMINRGYCNHYNTFKVFLLSFAINISKWHVQLIIWVVKPMLFHLSSCKGQWHAI